MQPSALLLDRQLMAAKAATAAQVVLQLPEQLETAAQREHPAAAATAVSDSQQR